MTVVYEKRKSMKVRLDSLKPGDAYTYTEPGENRKTYIVLGNRENIQGLAIDSVPVMRIEDSGAYNAFGGLLVFQCEVKVVVLL